MSTQQEVAEAANALDPEEKRKQKNALRHKLKKEKGAQRVRGIESQGTDYDETLDKRGGRFSASYDGPEGKSTTVKATVIPNMGHQHTVYLEENGD